MSERSPPTDLSADSIMKIRSRARGDGRGASAAAATTRGRGFARARDAKGRRSRGGRTGAATEVVTANMLARVRVCLPPAPRAAKRARIG